MMRNWLAPVHKERELVLPKDAFKRIVIVLEISNQDGRVAKSSPGADVAQDLARGQCGFGFGVSAEGQAERVGDVPCSMFSVRCSMFGVPCFVFRAPCF